MPCKYQGRLSTWSVASALGGDPRGHDPRFEANKHVLPVVLPPVAALSNAIGTTQRAICNLHCTSGQKCRYPDQLVSAALTLNAFSVSAAGRAKGTIQKGDWAWNKTACASKGGISAPVRMQPATILAVDLLYTGDPSTVQKHVAAKLFQAMLLDIRSQY